MGYWLDFAKVRNVGRIRKRSFRFNRHDVANIPVVRTNSITVVDAEFQSADGLVIVRVNIDDDDRRDQVIHRIVNLPSDEITDTLFEIHTGDWDDGLWDCLLYTSPSPRDRTRSRMPSSA